MANAGVMTMPETRVGESVGWLADQTQDNSTSSGKPADFPASSLSEIALTQGEHDDR
jgi:hypothetical protein